MDWWDRPSRQQHIIHKIRRRKKEKKRERKRKRKRGKERDAGKMERALAERKTKEISQN